MKPRDNPDLQDWLGGIPNPATDAAAADFFPWVWSDDADSSHAASAVVTEASFLRPGAESGGLQNDANDDVMALLQGCPVNRLEIVSKIRLLELKTTVWTTAGQGGCVWQTGDRRALHGHGHSIG
jgi:hypothetical protein